MYDIWVLYLTKFIERYEDSKVERTRDLFEQVLRSCPSERRKLFYYIYADFEENYGLHSHACEVYDRASQDV